MRLVAWPLVVAALGCHDLFSIDEIDPSDAAAGIEACEPLPYDANRYHFPPGRLFGLAWGTGGVGARDICARRAMDLAVFDLGDDDELSNQIAGAPAPFWLGVSYSNGWTAIDGCPPYLGWANDQPRMEAPGQCVVMGSDGMETRSCGHVVDEANEYIQALCETPRPSHACREGDARSRYALGSATDMSLNETRLLCSGMGMHVLEVNSTRELDAVRAQFPGLEPFWLDAQYTGSHWTSSNQCPLVFQWQSDEPNDSVNCAVMTVTGARTASWTTFMASAICESNT